MFIKHYFLFEKNAYKERKRTKKLSTAIFFSELDGIAELKNKPLYTCDSKASQACSRVATKFCDNFHEKNNFCFSKILLSQEIYVFAKI